MNITNLLFIKQGVTSYGHIEAGIQRAASGIPGLRMVVHDLVPFYREQSISLGTQPHPVRMNCAIQALLQQVLQDTSSTVLLLNGFVLETHCPGFFATLRKSGKIIISWQIDDPYYIDKTRSFASHLDLVLTVDSSTLPVYAALKKKAEFMPLACDPQLHHSYDDTADTYHCEVCFVGTPFAGSRRTRLIDDLADFLSKYDTRIIGATDLDSWRKGLTHFTELEACIHDARVGPEEAARYFSAARINLNLHKDSYGHVWDSNAECIEACSPAERSFAIAGCGGFQLIDDTRPDLARLFSSGEELVTFSDAPDLKKKIAYYLQHDDERQEIACAGQARAYAQHTYLHRLQAILALL